MEMYGDRTIRIAAPRGNLIHIMMKSGGGHTYEKV